MEKPKNKLAGLDKTKSFKQKKKIQKGSRGYGLKQIARMTLGSGNMQLAVELPAGEDLNEWLAVNTIEFYNEINVLYGILTEFCTAEICPTMSAGPKYEYLWADGHNVKTPLKVSASEYIDFLMTWVENQLNNEKIFPCQLGVPFPKNFINIIKVIFKRLFRVYAHIYHTHFQHIMLLSAETHLNTCFKHFIYFIDQFNLVDQKELAPLAELIQQFKERKNESEQKKIDAHPKKPAKDLSDTGIVNDQPGDSINDGQEDSFQRMYSKELDLDEDEVPIILHELNDSAIHFISRDQYDRALQLLQKAQTLIDKLGALEECALCLEASLQSINSPFLLPKFQGDPSRKLKKLKYECKAHMQVCALLSQLHRHKEALLHAEKSVMIAQYMINDLMQMCQHHYTKVLLAKKNEQIAQELLMVGENQEQQQQINKDLIYYDDSVSMLERTAFRIYPIIQEVASRMIKSDNNDNSKNKRPDMNESMKQKLNMKAVLGYLNQSEWLYLLNIGNIMQITPFTVHDLYSSSTFEVELTRDSILEKISFLAVSYFCMSTELRFLVQIKDDPNIDPARKKKESEFWHAKALEVSCSFLPSECPLVSHILTSYQKHHAPVQQEIPEDSEAAFQLKVIRPLPGIDICKFQPMVRQDEALNIIIARLPLSPNNYGAKKTTQNHLSLPFSPNNQGTTNASQNGMFSSQLANKVVTTESSSSNLVSSQRQNFTSQNRFHKNRNNIQRGKSGQNQAMNNHGSLDKFEKDQQKQENYQDENEESMILDINQSMMEVMPSSNYKKLLNDLSQIQGSSDVIEEDEDEEGGPQSNPNDQFFELDEDTSGGISGHQRNQESQEIEDIQDMRDERRKKTATAGQIVRRTFNGMNNDSSGQILDVSKDFLDDEDDLSESEELQQHQSHERHMRQKAKSKLQQHNLSVDGQKVKRPATSQGLRKSNKQMRQLTQIQNNTVRTQQQTLPKNLQDLKMIKATSAMSIAPSADGISPQNGPRLVNGSRTQHNQSMATTHGKISKLQTATGFNISQNQLPSGMQTDQRGNSTPVRSQSKHKSGNFTRDNRAGGQQSTGELINVSGKRNKSGKRQRNYESIAATVQLQNVIQPNSQSKRATQTQMNFNSVSGQKNGQRSQSQQKKYLTNSGTKQKSQHQEGLQKQLTHHNHSFIMTDQQNTSQAITDIFMAERLIKKRQIAANQTHDQSSKTFELGEHDPRYNSQLLSGGSNSKSKNRTKNANSSSRSKDKIHSKTQDIMQMNPQSLDELKRQILIKQALIDSGSSNARRKSTGSTALNSHSVSQTQLNLGQQQQQRKRIDHANNGSVGTTSATQIQQQMMVQGLSSQPQMQSQQIIPAQGQGKLKFNTHQLIKKFLNERQSNQNLNNSVFENYNDLSSYKLQLSKKIMQQQQKLLGQPPQAQQPGRSKKDQYMTEPHPKRSATPMLEMHEEASALNKGAPMGDIGNFHNQNASSQAGLNTFMKDYLASMSQHILPLGQAESLREDSFAKSLKKKKQQKKQTPKNTNVLANSQFSWL